VVNISRFHTRIPLRDPYLQGKTELPEVFFAFFPLINVDTTTKRKKYAVQRQNNVSNIFHDLASPRQGDKL
jgi:hypothetical protein